MQGTVARPIVVHLWTKIKMMLSLSLMVLPLAMHAVRKNSTCVLLGLDLGR